MDENMGDRLITNIDLNREPFLDRSPLLPIEDRIRHLEAVSSRARQSQRWRRIMSNPELSVLSVMNPIGGVSNENQRDNRLNFKRDVSQLVKALEMDSDANKKIVNEEDVDGNCNNGNFFDCNICLDMAKDPILTCCGHLFCWSCFYQVPYVDSISKECPVCKGEVIDSNLTPIYGNGKNSTPLELESGIKLPPRPQAHRVESVRQLSFGREISHFPVANAIQGLRFGLAMQGITMGPTSRINPSPGLQSLEAEASGEGHQLSRVTASFPFVSSAINSAERFFQSLENDFINETATTTVGIQSEPETVESIPAVPRTNEATTVLRLGALATDDGSVEIDLTIARPASARRTRASSRALNQEGGSSLERRRRRLR